MSWTDEQLRRFRAEMNTLGDEGCWFLSEREDPIVMKESDSVQRPPSCDLVEQETRPVLSYASSLEPRVCCKYVE